MQTTYQAIGFDADGITRYYDGPQRSLSTACAQLRYMKECGADGIEFAVFDTTREPAAVGTHIGAYRNPDHHRRTTA